MRSDFEFKFECMEYLTEGQLGCIGPSGNTSGNTFDSTAHEAESPDRRAVLGASTRDSVSGGATHRLAFASGFFIYGEPAARSV